MFSRQRRKSSNKTSFACLVNGMEVNYILQLIYIVFIFHKDQLCDRGKSFSELESR